MRYLRLAIPLLRTAVQSLMLHKLRSFLTMLGLVFGVASVIVMLAIAEGAASEAQKQIESLGVRNIIVRSMKPIADSSARNAEAETVLSYGLTWDDLERLKVAITVATGVTPLREFRQEVRHLNRSLEGRVVGVTPDYLQLKSGAIGVGRFIEPTDLSQLQNVCVLGSELAETLFPSEKPDSENRSDRRESLLSYCRRDSFPCADRRCGLKSQCRRLQSRRVHSAHNESGEVRRNHHVRNFWQSLI